MGVHKNQYSLVGAKFGYDEYHDLMKEQLEKEGFDFESKLDDIESPFHDSAFDGIQSHDGLTVITDGMNGEYVYIGSVYIKIDDNERLYKSDKSSESDVWEKIMKHFRLDCEIKDFSFTHYR